MDNKTKLKYKLQFEIEKAFADMAAKKENTKAAEAYKAGLITAAEFLKDSKLKDVYIVSI